MQQSLSRFRYLNEIQVQRFFLTQFYLTVTCESQLYSKNNVYDVEISYNSTHVPANANVSMLTRVAEVEAEAALFSEMEAEAEAVMKKLIEA